MNTLEIVSLSKTYHTGSMFSGKRSDVQALREVSFTLEPGFYGLLGPNGAGKSTLMNIIVGTLDQDKGYVLWNGKNTSKLGRAFRRELGYMPQQQNLYDNYTGIRFLYYIAALKGISREEAAEEAERAAAVVNMTPHLGKSLGAYSGGMKQRLLAAASIMGHPSLLIMDEPMAGLDPKERVHLRNVLADISKEAIVLVATHVVPDIETVADKVLILKQGQLHDMDSPEALERKYSSTTGMEGVYLSIFGTEDIDESS